MKIPCEDCITLGICASQAKGGFPFHTGVGYLMDKCQLFNNYIIYLMNKNDSFDEAYEEGFEIVNGKK